MGKQQTFGCFVWAVATGTWGVVLCKVGVSLQRLLPPKISLPLTTSMTDIKTQDTKNITSVWKEFYLPGKSKL